MKLSSNVMPWHRKRVLQRRLSHSAMFWDVARSAIDWQSHADWIIARVLQFGSIQDWHDMFVLYGSDRVHRVLHRSRALPDSVRQFWRDYWEVPRVLRPEVLAPGAANLLHQEGPFFASLPHFMLAGGTALALYLGHRQSEDLDFMTPIPPDMEAIRAEIIRRDPSVYIYEQTVGSLHVAWQGVKVSFLWQRGIQLDEGDTFEGCQLASIPSLVALKCNAVSGRAARKDFVDLYALHEAGWSLADWIKITTQRAPGLSTGHLLRSLTYFQDAVNEPEPLLFRDWSWHDIEQFFTNAVRAYIQTHIDT